MAGPYLTPGVYVEEIDSGPKPIQGVATAVAALIGFTQRAGPEKEPDKLLNKAELVTNWNQYVERFGGFIPDAYLPHAVFGFFNNGGQRCYVISVARQDQEKGETAQTVIPIGDDGKGQLLVQALNVGPDSNQLTVTIEHSETEALPEPEPPAETEATPDSGSGSKPASTKSDKPSSSKSSSSGKPSKTFSLIVQRGYEELARFDGLSLDSSLKTKVKSDWVKVEIQESSISALAERRPQEGSYKLSGGKYALTKATQNQIQGDPTKREGLGGLEALDDVTMVACPDLMTVCRKSDGTVDLTGIKSIQTAMLNHCEQMKYRFAIIDAPPGMSPQEVENWRFKQAMYDSKYGALYYPWIVVNDPLSSNGSTVTIPPSGHIAGLYSRIDSERGVHKAPANEIVRGAIDLEVNVTKGEQAGLNPKGINCIRAFPGMGIRVWGARTLSSNMAWNYINVRRLFNYVEASIEGGTQWVVFEPNDSTLWAKVRRDISSFLRTVWLSGALFGNSPEEAFYVKCDAELNPREIRDLGQLIVEIGMAPVKPAEFVIFRISQWAGPNAEE